MLTKNQVSQIKEHLEKAQNPVFFFDNDADGLCSFLLLQKYIGRGKGVPVRSFPGLTDSYIKKITELNSDYVFILDKPVVEESFFREIEKINLPVVWLDHHKIDNNKIPKFVNYYNPVLQESGKSVEAVSAFCYQISKREEDLWIAIVGCVSDNFVPEFYSEAVEKYPDLTVDSKDALDVYYNSEIGKIGRIFDFALKDRTTNVINMLRFLMKVKSPYDVLEKNSRNYMMHKRFEQIDRKYNKLVNKAIEVERTSGNEKILFFQYGGDLSISSEVSNKLAHLFPKKVVVVEDLEDASGGGHENALGAKIKTEDLEKFRNELEKLLD
jgi:nanoRNase/pAp phosphatase (c-di-AMP/oligoRNAs hydrolase)